LILQGEDDERCPKGQAEELFTRFMTTSETPAELILYPGSDHHFYENGKPSHAVDVVRRLVEWTTRWIGAAPDK
jgi:dipeptidyl aminopeptidase/acylaminoacyl peptidase